MKLSLLDLAIERDIVGIARACTFPSATTIRVG